MHRSALRCLKGRRGVGLFDAHDVAQDVVTTFLGDAGTITAAYTEPARYAHATAGSRLEDWRRRERSQRSEGARLTRTADDEPVVRRPYAPLTEFELERAPRRSDLEDHVIARIDLADVLASLEEDDRRLIVAVDVEGYSVTEAAAICGMSRAHASRRRTRALATLATALAEEVVAC